MTTPCISILTLFPDMFPGPLGSSVLGRALRKELWQLDVHNIRDHATDKHKTVDDTPYGGGAGMVMRPDIVAAAIRQVRQANSHVVYLSPAGQGFDAPKARKLAENTHLVLLCGHYEGIDQRVIDAEVDETLSIGNYVLSGGELAAMVLTDAVLRHVPSVLGSADSLHEESFDITDEAGQPLVEYPHYTRPSVWEGQAVPEVLLSGHHAEIQNWRHQQARQRTRQRAVIKKPTK